MEDPLAGADAAFQSRFLAGADGWQLRVLSWTPRDERAARRRPIVFVPGWISVIEGWLSLLAAWVEVRPVHYIETREKREARGPSGRRERVADFTIPTHARDLATIAGRLGVAKDGDWFASSLGSTTILEGLKTGVLEGRAAFLLAPNARFELPWWVAALSTLPWWVYPPLIRGALIPALRWKIEEEGQRVRYRRTLRSADVRRLKLSTSANRSYSVWAGLERIDIPCAICVARSDTLHAHQDALRIADMVPDGRIIEVASNQVAHEAESLPVIEGWLAEAAGPRSDISPPS